MKHQILPLCHFVNALIKFLQVMVVFALQKRNHELATLSEVARVPKGAEWLWHPQIVGLYNQVLQNCEMNNTTREAAAGALQNITAGEARVRHNSSAYPQSLKFLLITSEFTSALQLLLNTLICHVYMKNQP